MSEIDCLDKLTINQCISKDGILETVCLVVFSIKM